MSVTAGEIVEYLKGIGLRPTVFGSPDAIASKVVDIDDAEPGTLSWVRKGVHLTERQGGSIVLLGKGSDADRPCDSEAIITCDNPRLAFMKVVPKFFEDQIRERSVPVVASSADVHRTAVIGVEGQGYEWDEHECKLVSMPHVAGVIIGPDVYIGPHSTVMRGALRDTHIGRGTKIGNAVNVGHGVSIGEHCIIVAHATIGGSARIGNRVTIWQGAMIAHGGIRIGDGAIIGMGSVILESVPEGEVWVGNPGRKIR